MFVDLDTLLGPVEGDDPTGPNLEYDDAFTELERSAAGRPERQIGDTVQPAVPPEWPPILTSAVALLARAKDLRVAFTLCRALVGVGGLVGLAEGLEIVRGLLERWWDGVHPRLDPDDDDPTMRVNIIAGLADNDAVLRLLREQVVVASRATGRFTLKQILAAHAGADALESEAALIEAAFQDCPIEELREQVDALKRARIALQAIERTLVDNVGSSRAPDLSALSGLLREATNAVAPKLEARDGPPPMSVEAVEDEDGAAPPEAAAVAARPGVPRPGVIAGRADVAAAIDAICAYYAANEPSSPVPLILARAKRLINMNFLDLLRDLTPDGVSQFTTISGRSEESSD